MLMDHGRWCRRRLPRGPSSGDVGGERHGRRMHAVRRHGIELRPLRRRSSPPPGHELRSSRLSPDGGGGQISFVRSGGCSPRRLSRFGGARRRKRNGWQGDGGGGGGRGRLLRDSAAARYLRRRRLGRRSLLRMLMARSCEIRRRHQGRDGVAARSCYRRRRIGS